MKRWEERRRNEEMGGEESTGKRGERQGARLLYNSG